MLSSVRAAASPVAPGEPAGDTRYNPYPARMAVPLCPSAWSPGDLAAALVAGEQAIGAARAAIARAVAVSPARVVLTASGSAALSLALRSVARRPDDEVVMPTFACPSLAEAVLAAGMRPVLCDAGEDGAADAAEIAAHLGPRTRAVVAAHVLGAMVDVAALERVCADRGVVLIDDAAQALGGGLAGRPVGSFGDFGVLSFGRHKPVHAGGGGALIAPDADRARELQAAAGRAGIPSARRRALRQVAAERVHRASTSLLRGRAGFRDVARAIEAGAPTAAGAMDPFTASLVAAGLARIDETLRRAEIARWTYGAALADLTEVGALEARRPGPAALHTLLVPPGLRHALAGFLAARGIETTWLYYPLHRVSRYAAFAPRSCPAAEALWMRTLCLPCRGEHEPRAVLRVAATLRAFFPERR